MPAAPPLQMQPNAPLTRPDPDPTTLTTAQLYREILHARDLVETRLDGMDKAISLTQQYPTLLDRAVDSLKAEIAAAITTLKDLHGERFNAIATQFTERDTRMERSSQDRKDAIYAEFKSQQAAVALLNDSNRAAIEKSEKAFTKQIDGLSELMQALTKGFDGKVDDIKTRLTLIEGRSKGVGDSWGWLLGAVGLLGTIIATGFALKG